MQVTVKLLGFHGIPEVQKDLANGVMDLCLPEDATVEGLLSHLADKYGLVFASATRSGLKGLIRLSVFVGSEVLDDPQTRLASKLRPQSEISIALVRPLGGG